ncbi:MAG: hypothetical protein Q8N81_07390 [bacterium]|nr:hypothetical protein [bacterium]
MRIIFGLISLIIGILMLKFTFKIRNFFGKDPDLEQTFGAGLGGTFFFIKLVALAVIVLSVLYLFGLFTPAVPTFE